MKELKIKEDIEILIFQRVNYFIGNEGEIIWEKIRDSINCNIIYTMDFYFRSSLVNS